MKVGDYVRTKNKAPFEPSQIAKITDMKKDEGYKNQYFITLDHNLPTTYNFHIYSEDVIKSSSNIIDLIEVGDYVNGIKITDVYDDDKEVNDYNLKHKKCLGTNVYDEDFQEKLIYEEDIKSIVTKESMESVTYYVK